MNKHSVSVPTCATCDAKFKLKSKTSCGICGVKIHKKCGVFEDTINELICVDCFKNKRIEDGLRSRGIYDVKVEGDDLVRCYIGSHYWKEPTDLCIGEDCSCELTIDEYVDNDCCPYCGWRCEYEDSHIRYGNTGCKYITDMYDITITEDGDIYGVPKTIEIKTEDLEPFESSDFVK